MLDAIDLMPSFAAKGDYEQIGSLLSGKDFTGVEGYYIHNVLNIHTIHTMHTIHTIYTIQNSKKQLLSLFDLRVFPPTRRYL